MTTKVAARRAILQGLGRGGVATTTSAGSTNLLICTDFKSTILPTDHFDRAWFHVPSLTAPRQRRATTTALTPGTGQVAMDDAWGSSAGSGIAFEWCPLVPIISGTATSDGPSIEDAMYESLRHFVFADEVTIALVANQDEYSLATWAAWLNRSDRLADVLRPSPHPTQTRPISATAHGWSLILDGETPRLRLDVPFPASSGNLTLQVRRPADTWFRVSGTWTETAPGTALAAETDEVNLDLAQIRAGGLVFVYQALAAGREGPRRAEYQALYERQLELARALPNWDHSVDDLLPRPNAPTPAPAAEAA